MLRRLASTGSETDGTPSPPNPERIALILRLDPTAIALLLEYGWQNRAIGVTGVDPTPEFYGTSLFDVEGVAELIEGIGERRVLWDHLIYAYLVENTRAVEIFARAVRDLLIGERLGVPQNADTYRWLRTTEELFLKDASPYQPQALVSRIRPDIGATRRNAYYRMFGMDLNHGRDGQPGYPYDKPDAANREFVGVLEEFLREVWRGIENRDNVNGPNPADPEAIANLALRIQNMLLARRGSSTAGAQNLAREEYDFVNAMAWFHLTLLIDSPIVSDLKATGPSPEDRLRLLGERVGVPAHARSHSYFILAPAMSVLLRQIEAGSYTNAVDAENLYRGPAAIRVMLSSIITHWSMATGRDLKVPRVGGGMAPVAMRPAAPVAEVTSGNGKAPAEVLRS